MAYIIDKKVEYCSCCNAKAVTIEWSCGCVTVEVSDGDKGWCEDCDVFTDKRRNCGKSGCPAG
jgi:hypothetical protein